MGERHSQYSLTQTHGHIYRDGRRLTHASARTRSCYGEPDCMRDMEYCQRQRGGALPTWAGASAGLAVYT